MTRSHHWDAPGVELVGRYRISRRRPAARAHRSLPSSTSTWRYPSMRPSAAYSRDWSPVGSFSSMTALTERPGLGLVSATPDSFER